MSQWQQQKESVLAAARRMVERGLVTGTSGNVSLRLPRHEGRDILAVTPSSLAYHTLSSADIQIVGFDGHAVEGKLAPSMETELHSRIYAARPDVGAIIHTHSLHACAAAVTGRDIPPITEEQVFTLGGEISCAPYAPSGTTELATAALTALGDRGAALLQNHGALAAAADLDSAFAAAELLEKTARIYLLAAAAGPVTTLPPEAVRQWQAHYLSHRARPS